MQSPEHFPIINQPYNRTVHTAEPSAETIAADSQALIDDVRSNVLSAYSPEGGDYTVPTSAQIGNLYGLAGRLSSDDSSHLSQEFGGLPLADTTAKTGSSSDAKAVGEHILVLNQHKPWLLHTDSAAEGSLESEDAVHDAATAASAAELPQAFQADYDKFCATAERSDLTKEAQWEAYKTYQQRRYDLHKVMQAHEAHVTYGLQTAEVTGRNYDQDDPASTAGATTHVAQTVVSASVDFPRHESADDEEDTQNGPGTTPSAAQSNMKATTTPAATADHPHRRVATGSDTQMRRTFSMPDGRTVTLRFPGDPKAHATGASSPATRFATSKTYRISASGRAVLVPDAPTPTVPVEWRGLLPHLKPNSADDDTSSDAKVA